jgi:hypothetical protein
VLGALIHTALGLINLADGLGRKENLPLLDQPDKPIRVKKCLTGE